MDVCLGGLVFVFLAIGFPRVHIRFRPSRISQLRLSKRSDKITVRRKLKMPRFKITRRAKKPRVGFYELRIRLQVALGESNEGDHTLKESSYQYIA
jgi:hypothetical protein